MFLYEAYIIIYKSTKQDSNFHIFFLLQQHHEASDEGVEDVKPVIKGNKAQNIDNGLTNQENPEDGISILSLLWERWE